MMPGDPVVGGTVLRRAAIQSPNYAAGSAGWTINADGSAEFNDLDIRGTFEGLDFVVNSAGAFFYSGVPAAGNLVASVAGGGGTDEYGNAYQAGVVSYGGTGLWAALQSGQLLFDSGSVIAEGVPAGSLWLIPAADLVVSAGGSGVLTAGAASVALAVPVILQGQASPPAAVPGSSIIYGDAASQAPAAVTPTGWAGPVALSKTDISTINLGNVTSPAAITAAYPVDAGALAPTVYTLKTWFNGTWGAQVLTIWADISGTMTAVGTVGAAFASGAASGNQVNGWLELEIEIVASGLCRLHLAGAIHDQSLNANNSATVTSAISGTVVTGVPIAAGDTVALAASFAASASGQTIQTQGSRFTRHA